MVYKKPDDHFVLSEIQEVLKIRPTYGYKRVTAMINKIRTRNSQNRLNKKRILRIMRINGLVYPKVGAARTHEATGKVMTLHSNTR